MSHREPGWERDARSWGLARRSLLYGSMAVALLAAGCVVADPPPFSDPAKTPPVLSLGEANPPVYQIQPLSLTSETKLVLINVPVRSEDAGDDLVALLFVNWNVASNETASPIAKAREPASTFNDTGRSIEMVWDYQKTTPGCWQLTMLVTHESNYDWIRSSYGNPADIAIATWFFNVEDDPPGTNPLSGCPKPAGMVP